MGTNANFVILDKQELERVGFPISRNGAYLVHMLTVEDIVHTHQLKHNCSSEELQSHISGVCSLNNTRQGEIFFLTIPSHVHKLVDIKAKFCVCTEEVAIEIERANLPIAPLVSPDPEYHIAAISKQIYRRFFVKDDHKLTSNDSYYIEPGALVSTTAKIGEGSIIREGSYIGRNVVIGKNTIVGALSSIEHAEIGDNCVIQNGAKIGQDGFGYVFDKGTGRGFISIPQLGKVIVGNNVEIGSNSCIDRGRFDDTIIGDHTKIDNLVQIGHNCVLGEGNIICGHVAIAGSMKFGMYNLVGGSSAFSGHTTVGNKVKIAGGSGVMADIADGEIVSGIPASPIKEWRMQQMVMRIFSRMTSKQLSKFRRWLEGDEGK